MEARITLVIDFWDSNFDLDLQGSVWAFWKLKASAIENLTDLIVIFRKLQGLNWTLLKVGELLIYREMQIVSVS